MRITFFIIICILHSLNAQTEEVKRNKMILGQKTETRTYKNIQFKLLNYIPFDSLKSVIYRPTFCQVNSKGEIFILDYSTQKIHKFIFTEGYKKYSIRTFGNGKGQGPGEFINPTDFKIYGDTLFLVDPMKGTIEIYFDNSFVTSLKLEKSSIPERIVVTAQNYIVIPQNSASDLDFKVFSKSGRYLNKIDIDKYIIDKNKQVLSSELFQDNIKKKFYLLPKATGFLGIFNYNGSIEKFIYTIDGPKVSRIKMKKMMDNIVVGKIDIKFFTISNILVSDKFILVKAKDIEKDKRYYDVYLRDSFTYKYSISEMPYYNFSSIYKNYMFCVDDYGMKIYNIQSLLN